MAPTCNSFSGSKRPFPWFLLKTLYSFIVFIILRETKTFSESQWPLKASFWRLTWAILLGLWKPSGQVWAKASPGASRTSLRRIYDGWLIGWCRWCSACVMMGDFQDFSSRIMAIHPFLLFCWFEEVLEVYLCFGLSKAFRSTFRQGTCFMIAFQC